MHQQGILKICGRANQRILENQKLPGKQKRACGGKGPYLGPLYQLFAPGHTLFNNISITLTIQESHVVVQMGQGLIRTKQHDHRTDRVHLNVAMETHCG